MPGLELGARIRAGACLPAYVEKWKRGYRNTSVVAPWRRRCWDRSAGCRVQ